MPELIVPLTETSAVSGHAGPLGRLTERTVIAFLGEKGLLNPQAIVDGQVKVQRVSRRNLSFRVTTTVDQNSFVKQGLGVERASTVAREAAFLRTIDSSTNSERLRRYLPQVRDWDEERRILVFDLVPGARSLAEHHHQTGRWSSALARFTASALRELHRWQPTSGDIAGGKEADGRPPWILSIHRPDQAQLNRMSSGSLEIIKIVQAARPLVAAFDELRAGWRPSSIIHGDVKWDNFVVQPNRRAKGARLTLVDWEMVQRGDPLWDAGSYLSQYLDTWIASIPAAGSSVLSQARAAGVPLERLQPAMRRFWESYAGGAGLETGDGVALEQMVRYAAARLVQTAVEGEFQSPVLSNTGVLRLQVAQNMLQRPGMAATSLLGLVPVRAIER